MKSQDHTREQEEVMAYVDGALDAEAAARVRAHLTSCAECREAERALRAVSTDLAGWVVGEAPGTLRVRPAPPASVHERLASALAWLTTPRRLAAVGASAAALVVVASLIQPQIKAPNLQTETAPEAYRDLGDRAELRRPSSLIAAAEPVAPSRGDQAATQGPLIVRTARLTIVANDFDAARSELEKLVQNAGGFVGQMVAEGGAGAARRLEATLRVPTPKLDEVVASLRRLGSVVAEAQDGEDVTQQSADLDTRLANARVAEKRLRDVLAQRTGKLSDILEVEREIARVRGEIEQMESERRALDRRVTYATIAVSLTEDRKAEVNLGPVPVTRRLRNAFVEGWQDAVGTLIGLALFAVRIAPTLLVWGIILGIPAFALRKRIFVRRPAAP